MDILTFVAELIKALAWPLAVLALALLFRGQLQALLARIRKGKVGPAEFEFEQEVKELAEQEPARQLPPPSIGTPAVTLATTNPRAAILEAWLSVESSVQKLAYKHQIAEPSASRNPASLIRALEKSGVIPFEYLALFNDLRTLRNQATHDPEFSPSPESVIQYVQISYALKERLDRIYASER